MTYFLFFFPRETGDWTQIVGYTCRFVSCSLVRRVNDTSCRESLVRRLVCCVRLAMYADKFDWTEWVQVIWRQNRAMTPHNGFSCFPIRSRNSHPPFYSSFEIFIATSCRSDWLAATDKRHEPNIYWFIHKSLGKKSNQWQNTVWLSPYSLECVE